MRNLTMAVWRADRQPEPMVCVTQVRQYVLKPNHKGRQNLNHGAGVLQTQLRRQVSAVS
jgi:hypothetical protein